jgi:aromatic ring hydroxylase
MPKNGKDHLLSLRDGRQIFIDGQLVKDHVCHPAFRSSIRSVAAMYDYQAAAENMKKMTFPSPTTGNCVNRMWQLPTSYHELVERRAALEAWATLSVRVSWPLARSCGLGALRHVHGTRYLPPAWQEIWPGTLPTTNMPATTTYI